MFLFARIFIHFFTRFYFLAGIFFLATVFLMTAGIVLLFAWVFSLILLFTWTRFFNFAFARICRLLKLYNYINNYITMHLEHIHPYILELSIRGAMSFATNQYFSLPTTNILYIPEKSEFSYWLTGWYGRLQLPVWGLVNKLLCIYLILFPTLNL